MIGESKNWQTKEQPKMVYGTNKKKSSVNKCGRDARNGFQLFSHEPRISALQGTLYSYSYIHSSCMYDQRMLLQATYQAPPPEAGSGSDLVSLSLIKSNSILLTRSSSTMIMWPTDKIPHQLFRW